ncbi:MAG: preprotein translocase subunit YajC [Oscillospiraceae bacterium]|nr:preprotein translocase subunit YajC [Oscillospiraceae bacterium]
MAGGIGAMFTTLGIPLLLLVFLYFIMIRPQQKQEKETREMQKNLQIGDEVVTIGGIVGIVLRVEEATGTVVLETGSDRLKIRLKQDAIRENITAAEQLAAEKAEKEKKKQNPVILGKPKDE